MFGTFKATKDKTLKTKIKIDGKTYVYFMKLGEVSENYEKYKNDMQTAENRIAYLKNTEPSGVQDYNKKMKDAQIMYGTAVQYLFHVVFGEKVTEKLLEFYEGDYETMLIRTIPYIKNTIGKNVAKFLKNLRKLMADVNDRS